MAVRGAKDWALTAERLRLHRKTVGSSVVATAFLGVLLATLLWPTGDRGSLSLWLGCLVLALAARLAVAWGHGRAVPGQSDGAAWLWRYRLVFAAHGLVWAMLGGLFLPQADEWQLILLTVGLIGISAGSLIATAFDMVAAEMFAVPALTPMIVLMSTHGDQASLGLSVMVSLFILIAFVSALRAQQAVRDSVTQQRRLKKLITQSKRAEQGLIDAQAIAHVGSFDWNPVTGELQWSDEHFRLWGLEPQSVTPSYDLFRKAIHPGDMTRLEEVLQQTLHGNRDYECEHRVVWPDGSERHIHGRGEATFDAAGQAVRLQGTVQDITERNRRSEEIEHLSARLQLAVDSAGIGIWDLDLRSGLVYLTPTAYEIGGYSPGEVKADLDFLKRTVHPEDLPKVIEPMEAHIQGKTASAVIEYRLVARSGEIKWISGRGRVVGRNSKGGPLRIIGTLTDVTERKLAEQSLIAAREEADRANRAKSTFLSSMSHELRTPLNAILGFAQLLEIDKSFSTREQQESVTHILAAGHQLLGLINDVLDLSRIDIGKLQLNILPVGMAELSSSCVSQVAAAMAGQRHISIDNTISDTALRVRGDNLRIRQVLLNLLSNAVKYNKDHGRITLSSVVESPDRLRINVRDTGNGIDGDKLPLLFTPFERIDQAHGTISGVGIGLHITKQLVEAMHGTVGVDSAPGEGSTFWFELPLAAAEESMPASDKPLPAMVHDESRFVVLYIEDNPVNLKLVDRALQGRPGIALLTAATAEDGLSIAAEDLPDLILMDIQLPGIDGVTATTLLKGVAATRDIPVVALSAGAAKEDIDRALGAGCSAYLTKPIDLLALYALIDHMRGAASHEHQP